MPRLTEMLALYMNGANLKHGVLRDGGQMPHGVMLKLPFKGFVVIIAEPF